jgi:Rrf2 family protein
MLSQTAEYALRAAIRLASRPDADPVRVEDLAAELDLPRNYLSKILHTLARKEVLESVKGPGGGFRLAGPPAELTLFEVVSQFDDLSPGRTCVLGRPCCSDTDPCPVHERWFPVSERIAQFFRETTLADAAAGVSEVR